MNYEFTFKDGKLSEVNLPWNHSEFVTDFEVIKGTEASAIFVKVQHDLYTYQEIEDAKAKNQPIPEDKQTISMWYVFFAQEGYDKSYSLFLNCDYFTQEDMLFIARSVSFADQAFNEYYYGA